VAPAVVTRVVPDAVVEADAGAESPADRARKPRLATTPRRVARSDGRQPRAGSRLIRTRRTRIGQYTKPRGFIRWSTTAARSFAIADSSPFTQPTVDSTRALSQRFWSTQETSPTLRVGHPPTGLSIGVDDNAGGLAKAHCRDARRSASARATVRIDCGTFSSSTRQSRQSPGSRVTFGEAPADARDTLRSTLRGGRRALCPGSPTLSAVACSESPVGLESRKKAGPP
jgi:hypothetical protein